jgi:hypothetical protein
MPASASESSLQRVEGTGIRAATPRAVATADVLQVLTAPAGRGRTVHPSSHLLSGVHESRNRVHRPHRLRGLLGASWLHRACRGTLIAPAELPGSRPAAACGQRADWRRGREHDITCHRSTVMATLPRTRPSSSCRRASRASSSG